MTHQDPAGWARSWQKVGQSDWYGFGNQHSTTSEPTDPSSPPTNPNTNVADEADLAPLTAILIPPLLQLRERFSGKYLVQFADTIIASGRDAECSACRWLVRHGYSGQLRIVDSATGKHRSTINIEKAARLTVKEGPHGPYFAKWEPAERSAETEECGS